jgi:hypothetical protein
VHISNLHVFGKREVFVRRICPAYRLNNPGSPTGAQCCPSVFIRLPLLFFFLSFGGAVFTSQAVIADPAAHPCLDVTSLDQGVPVSAQAEEHLFSGPRGNQYIPADILPVKIPAETGDQLLAYPAGPRNRWGYIPAWIYDRSEQGHPPSLLQENWLAAGVAQASPHYGDISCTERLDAAETVARRENLGLWKDHGIFSTRQAKRLSNAAGTYVIAEGRIVSLGKTRNTRYLNFGRYWKRDLTATVPVSSETLFEKALARYGLALDDLAGRAVRLRGVIEVHDGPLIRLTHPGQLIVLDGEKDKK